MTASAMSSLIDRYLGELIEEGVLDPLHEEFTLSAVLEDLVRLADQYDPEAWPPDDVRPYATA